MSLEVCQPCQNLYNLTTGPNAECRNASSACFVVDAEMTLYGDIAGSLLDETKGYLEVSMDNGEFDQGIDNRILTVRFLNDSDIDRLVDDPDPVLKDTDDFSKALPAWAAVLIGIGTILAVAILCACPLSCGSDTDEDSAKSHSLNEEQQHRLVVDNLPAYEEVDNTLFAIPDEEVDNALFAIPDEEVDNALFATIPELSSVSFSPTSTSTVV